MSSSSETTLSAPPADNSSSNSKFSNSFSNLYCGAVCIVHSFLSIQELIQLVQVCHYHRRIVAGLLTPGRVNSSSLKVWDVLEHVPNNLPPGGSLLESNLPQFEWFIETERAKYQQQHNESLSDENDKSFHAVMPSLPISKFISNSTARTVTLPPSMYSQDFIQQDDKARNQFFLSSTITRHMHDLVIPPRLDGYYLVNLIATRFPFLQSLSIRLMLLTVSGQGQVEHPPQFPSQLRSLTLKFDSNFFNASGLCRQLEVSNLNKIIADLPRQCPLIEELTIDVPLFDHANLSALTALPHLTRLTLWNRSGTHQCLMHKQERAMRVVGEGTRTMLLHAGAPLMLWSLAIVEFVYILNRGRAYRDTGKTPHQLWTGEETPLDISDFRVWGCEAYADLVQ